MLQIKGYKQSKRCSTYVKKMISRGFWGLNEPISSINTIATKLDISYPTVRNVLKQFERDGVLASWGKLGYFLISDSLVGTKKVSKNQHFLRMVQTSLTAFDILRNKGIQKRNWLIHFNKETKTIIGLNEISGSSIKSSLDEILDLQENLLSLSNVLRNKNFKRKFDRQREILPLARLVINHKKELGINE